MKNTPYGGSWRCSYIAVHWSLAVHDASNQGYGTSGYLRDRKLSPQDGDGYLTAEELTKGLKDCDIFANVSDIMQVWNNN